MRRLEARAALLQQAAEGAGGALADEVAVYQRENEELRRRCQHAGDQIRELMYATACFAHFVLLHISLYHISLLFMNCGAQCGEGACSLRPRACCVQYTTAAQEAEQRMRDAQHEVKSLQRRVQALELQLADAQHAAEAEQQAALAAQQERWTEAMRLQADTRRLEYVLICSLVLFNSFS